MNLFAITLTFFVVANPVGNVPVVLSLLKEYPFKRQMQILLRESMIAFALALFFLFLGAPFLDILGLKDFAVKVCGGFMLLLTALKMIFPMPEQLGTKTKQEPMIVPIATPLISGPGLLTIIMMYAQQENDLLKMTSAIVLTYIGVTAVLMGAPFLQRALGHRGMTALEQLMGMVLAMMSTDMIVSGTALFIKSINI